MPQEPSKKATGTVSLLSSVLTLPKILEVEEKKNNKFTWWVLNSLKI
jgi:hypothetical protein